MGSRGGKRTCGKAATGGLGQARGQLAERQSHICMQVNLEEQLESERLCNPGFQCRELKPQTSDWTCGGWGGRRNSKPHRRVYWGDPQGPRMYTNPLTWKSAPEGPNLLVRSLRNDWKPARAKQVAFFPLGPLPHIQSHHAVMWAAPPWRIPKVSPLTM